MGPRHALAAAALVAAGCAASSDDVPAPDAARLMEELMSGRFTVGGPFELEDVHGVRRSLASFRGRIVVLYFGYTYCPDVCPTDLARIGRALAALSPRDVEVQPLFVTLDPERDTPELLRAYVDAFDRRIVALRGTERETRRVATAYKVFYERRAGSPLLDHSSFIFLLDREGRYVSFLPPGTSVERIAAALRELLH